MRTALMGDTRVIGAAANLSRRATDLDLLRRFVDAGRYRSVVDRSYPDAAAAHRYVEQGHKRGNVVITID